MSDFNRYQVNLNVDQPKYSYSYGSNQDYAKAQKEYVEKINTTFFGLVNDIVEWGGIVEINKYCQGSGETYFFVLLSEELYQKARNHKGIRSMTLHNNGYEI